MRVFLAVIESENLADEPKSNLPWNLQIHCFHLVQFCRYLAFSAILLPRIIMAVDRVKVAW